MLHTDQYMVPSLGLCKIYFDLAYSVEHLRHKLFIEFVCCLSNDLSIRGVRFRHDSVYGVECLEILEKFQHILLVLQVI